MRDTLKPALFNVELLCRPRATEHYVNYLKQHYEMDKLMDILGCVAFWMNTTCFYRATLC